MKKKLTGGASVVQHAASLMSKSLSEFESTIKKMNELTEKASKENLTALDRINMQIEFENLRENLAGASAKLNEEFAKISGKKTERENLIDTEEIQADAKNILERARDRIINGQDWNIAENDDALTVREKIKASGTVDLMSSVSAKKGIERIQNQIEDVKKMRENFSSFLMSYDGQDLEGGIKISDLPAEM